MNLFLNLKSTNWKSPHISKIYEALTAIADSRIELISSTHAKCFSSSRNKYYEVEFDPISKSFMSNDNSAYYTDTLSYPMIATLILINKISYNNNLLAALKGILWKDINQKYKNDYDKALNKVMEIMAKQGVNIDIMKSEVMKIYEIINGLEFKQLGKKRLPPNDY